jgi:hypothetical protein
MKERKRGRESGGGNASGLIDLGLGISPSKTRQPPSSQPKPRLAKLVTSVSPDPIGRVQITDSQTRRLASPTAIPACRDDTR